MAVDDIKDRYAFIASELAAGSMIPFLGAGASVDCGMPSSAALARCLYEAAEYPDPAGLGDLARVASYLSVLTGPPRVRRELRPFFEKDIQPGPLHRYLASLDELRLIVTTNYDDLIERALLESWEAGGRQEARQPWIVVDRIEKQNRVWLGSADGKWQEIPTNALHKFITNKRQPIVFKLHGSFNRAEKEDDSYLVTEEHYLEFLGRGPKLMAPPLIETRMQQRHFLYIGYALRDWNVRALMARIRQAQVDKTYKSIAVMRPAEDEKRRMARLVESVLWQRQEITILETPIGDLLDKIGAPARAAMAP